MIRLLKGVDGQNLLETLGGRRQLHGVLHAAHGAAPPTKADGGVVRALGHTLLALGAAGGEVDAHGALGVEGQTQEALAVRLAHVGAIQHEALPGVLGDGADGVLEGVPARQLILAEALVALVRLHQLLSEGALAAAWQTHEEQHGGLVHLGLPVEARHRRRLRRRGARGRAGAGGSCAAGSRRLLAVDLEQLLLQGVVLRGQLEALQRGVPGVPELAQQTQTPRQAQKRPREVRPQLCGLPKELRGLLKLLVVLPFLLARFQRLHGCRRLLLPAGHGLRGVLRGPWPVERAAGPVQDNVRSAAPQQADHLLSLGGEEDHAAAAVFGLLIAL
mmetsp:Transcript_128262/g.304582  ORF Transcript_128262/g.304582 Transcript_128262/m.304582 type:complete len:332 (-) Transcript_128262:561-1556(-)